MTDIKLLVKKVRYAGRDPVITVRFEPGKIAPDSFNQFKQDLAHILTLAKPAFAAIGGNETSLVPDVMSLKSYVTLLARSLEVAAETCTKCLNGGIEAGALLTAYLTSWADNDNHSALLDQLDPNERSYFTDSTFNKEREQASQTVTSLLEEYKNMGLGYVNLHWNTYPISVFTKISTLILKEYGLRTVSTEMEIPMDPDRHDRTLRSVKDLGLDCVIWYFPFEGRFSKAIFQDNTLTKLSRPLRDINRSLY